MRYPRRLTTALAVAVAALAAACGDGESETGSVTSGRQQGGEGAQTTLPERDGGKVGSTDADAGESSDPGTGEQAPDGFVPQEHEDSGGGSAQLRVQGGDNSVQEFGAEASGSEFDQAAAALHGFLDARAQGAWAAACGYLSRDVAESLRRLVPPSAGATGCAALLAKLTNPAAKQELLAEARGADVGSLRVEGERAFVIYRGPDGTIMAMLMRQEDGGWKVASLAAVPLS